jgi:spore germination protein GerM
MALALAGGCCWHWRPTAPGAAWRGTATRAGQLVDQVSQLLAARTELGFADQATSRALRAEMSTTAAALRTLLTGPTA